MLAYYVEWRMREAWRALTFADEHQDAPLARDPVAPATRSPKSQAKASSRTLPDATPVHSFATLMAHLAAIVRNSCRAPKAGDLARTFQVTTTPNAKQEHALKLIQTIAVWTVRKGQLQGDALNVRGKSLQLRSNFSPGRLSGATAKHFPTGFGL